MLRRSSLFSAVRAGSLPPAALGELVDRKARFPAAALLASAAAQACYGNIARDPAEKRLQTVRALRRHGVPGREPRIVHALLRVLGIPQEIIRHRVAIRPVGILRFRDGALGALQ